MVNKYNYSGVVDIDQVLMDMYRRKIAAGERFKSSPYMRSTLELHNKGLSPLEISKELSKLPGAGKISTGRVVDWLESAAVKPNESKRSPRHAEYKVLSESMFNSIVIEMMGSGVSAYDVVKSKFNSIVTYDDDTAEIIKSKAVFDNIMKVSRSKYVGV